MSAVLEVADGLRWSDPRLSAALAEHVVRVAGDDAEVRTLAGRAAVRALGELDHGPDVISRAVPLLLAAVREDRDVDAAALRCDVAAAAVTCGDTDAARDLLAPVVERELPASLRAAVALRSAEWRAACGDVAGADGALALADVAVHGGTADRATLTVLRQDMERARATARRVGGDPAGALDVLRAIRQAGGTDRGRRSATLVADQVDALLDLRRISAARARAAETLGVGSDPATSLPVGRIRCALAERVHLPARELDDAERMARAAETELAAQGYDRESARALALLAAVAEARGDLAGALAAVREAHARELRAHDTVAAARRMLAVALVELQAARPPVLGRAGPPREAPTPPAEDVAPSPAAPEPPREASPEPGLDPAGAATLPADRGPALTSLPPELPVWAQVRAAHRRPDEPVDDDGAHGAVAETGGTEPPAQEADRPPRYGWRNGADVADEPLRSSRRSRHEKRVDADDEAVGLPARRAREAAPLFDAFSTAPFGADDGDPVPRSGESPVRDPYREDASASLLAPSLTPSRGTGDPAGDLPYPGRPVDGSGNGTAPPREPFGEPVSSRVTDVAGSPSVRPVGTPDPWSTPAPASYGSEGGSRPGGERPAGNGRPDDVEPRRPLAARGPHEVDRQAAGWPALSRERDDAPDLPARGDVPARGDRAAGRPVDPEPTDVARPGGVPADARPPGSRERSREHDDVVDPELRLTLAGLLAEYDLPEQDRTRAAGPGHDAGGSRAGGDAPAVSSGRLGAPVPSAPHAPAPREVPDLNGAVPQARPGDDADSGARLADLLADAMDAFRRTGSAHLDGSPWDRAPSARR